MKKSFIPVIVLVIVLGCFCICQANPDVIMRPSYEHLLPQLEKSSLDIFRDHDGKGAVAVLVEGDRMVWCFGMGYRDHAEKEPVNCDTGFHLGSASALFTVAATLKLIEENRLSMQTPVDNCSHSVRVRSRFADTRLTIRESLRHHSGLPKNVINGKWRTPLSPKTNSVLQVDAISSPGYIFSMSDLAMVQLGDCIARAAGKTFTRYMHEEVLLPLGMGNSRFITGIIPENTADNFKDGKHQQRVWDRDVAAGGLVSTGRDLAKFLASHHVQQNVFSKKLLQTMQEPQNTDVIMDLGTRIGFGWVLDAFPVSSEKLVAHFSGDALFHRSQIVYVPSAGAGVVVIANNWRSRQMVDAIARTILTRFLADRKVEVNVRGIDLDGTGVKSTNIFTAAMLGSYASWKGMLNIEGNGQDYKMQIGGRTLDLERESAGYAMVYRLFGMFPINIPALKEIFIKPAEVDNKKYLVANFRGADFIWAEKISRSGLTENWRKRAGDYTIMNQDKVQPIEQMGLELKDDLLLARFTVPGFLDDVARFPLRIVSDTQAIVAGLGNGFGETVRVISENPVKIEFSGFVAQKN